MKLNKFFLLFSVAVMAVACQDKKDADITPANPGDEVDFGATLEDNELSRTIYGPENVRDHNFPINWCKGDQVFVASPDCNPGRSTGTYQVPDDAQDRDYAGGLNKVGQTGVQWGSKEFADFYSVYPQRSGDFEVTTTTGSSFNLNMPSVQTCIVEGTGSSLKMTTADMYACFMWAKTAGVQRGATVNLRYNPLSTAIRFKLKGNANIPVTVTQIRLYGPRGTAISGKFSVDLSSGDPVVKPSTTAGETSNMVTIFARDKNQNYLILNPDETIELNAFIIPQETQINQDWSIEVVLSTGNTLTKKLTPNSTATAANTTLKPGMIHRLPDLPNLVPGKMDPSKWMTYIPRNVYLSEISIPGSWNSLNRDFQEVNDTSIAAQYNKGVRFFHLDTRYRCNSFWSTLTEWETRFTLGVANGGASTTIKIGGNNEHVMQAWGCLYFSEYLKQIVNHVKTDEYLVLMCTFAQDSFVPVSRITSIYYDRCPKRSWMADVSEACNDASITDKIFDARNLTPNTTVGEALGKVIVIVNCESEISGTNLTLPDNSKCLFTYMPMKRLQNMYTSGFSTDKLYNRIVNGTTTTTNNTGITFNNTQAQITSSTASGINTSKRGYAPTLAERKSIGQNILTWAEDTYTSGSYAHDVWYYQGLGGYQVSDADASFVSGSYATIAQDLNLWLNSKILNMKANPGSTNSRFFPVGLILMNYVTNATYGTPVVYNILQLNYQFHKQFDPNKPAWP